MLQDWQQQERSFLKSICLNRHKAWLSAPHQRHLFAMVISSTVTDRLEVPIEQPKSWK